MKVENGLYLKQPFICLDSVTDSTSDFGSASEGSNPSRGTMIGEIKLIAGNSVPANWLRCDGKAYNPNSYADLFSVIRYRFGKRKVLLADWFCVPSTDEIAVSAHLEPAGPEAKGIHEKVVTQVKAGTLPEIKGMQWIIRYAEDPAFTSVQEDRIKEIVRGMLP